MSSNKYYQLVFISTEYVADASLIYLYGNNIEDSEKLDIFINIEFKAIVP